MVEKLMNVASISRVGCICNLDLKMLLETVERTWVKNVRLLRWISSQYQVTGKTNGKDKYKNK